MHIAASPLPSLPHRAPGLVSVVGLERILSDLLQAAQAGSRTERLQGGAAAAYPEAEKITETSKGAVITSSRFWKIDRANYLYVGPEGR
jgi:hypothetical protein